MAFCSNCGAQVEDGAAFCDSCGARLESARRPSAPAAKGSKKGLVITLAALLVVGAAFVFWLVFLPRLKLNKAVRLIDSGNYEAAYRLLDGMDYENSRELQNSIRTQYLKAVLSKATVGSSVYFGHYEQDNDFSNGSEEIEWLVLAKENDRVLVISKYALECRKYHFYDDYITWENCSLRTWLNETFIDIAFGDEERSLILSLTVSADKNPQFNTNPGNSTQDQVFLLSISEVNTYFHSDQERRCLPTEYAVAQGCHVNEATGYCEWWLRSPGIIPSRAACILDSGYVYNDGAFVGGNHPMHGENVVRPAMWLDISG